MSIEDGFEDEGNERSLAVVETAANAVAARERAAIEARYVVALKRPRDMDDVRVRLLKECARPGFAEVAKYEKPLGNKKFAVGLSVRFAETAVRVAGNILTQVLIVFDDSERRIFRVSVCDLENNVPYESDILLEKRVERSTLREDQTAIGERTNSQGRRVYIVEATEDDFANKVNAQISKTLRNFALRLIPGDILEECSRQIDVTYGNKAAQDPEGEKKKIIDSFASLGVKPTQLAEYLGHALDTVVPAELVSLRRVYQSIRDGETTWLSAMETEGVKAPGGGEKPKRKSEQNGNGGNGNGGSHAGTEPATPAATTAATATVTTAATAETATELRHEPTPDGGHITHLEGGGVVKHPPKIPGQPDMKEIGRIYELGALYDKKHGDGSMKKEMGERYNTQSPSKLTIEQAAEFTGILEKAVAA